ncbi:hypothetical protein FHL15_000358 [Xylaria flabelliformis]|uniref:Uncharacterized protein n=1 Tax=Xylaria flabelliformis TaxID=2512241 RepID=A0A553IFN2_9PEZI|nr:hypothetical protein FHL15_000358 [Xylaria flabelliformis]
MDFEACNADRSATPEQAAYSSTKVGVHMVAISCLRVLQVVHSAYNNLTSRESMKGLEIIEMGVLHFDTFNALPEDDMSDISVISRSEVDSYCTYPDNFIPCKKCKKKKQGSPPCWKCWLSSLQRQRENDEKNPQEPVTQRTHSVLSSSISTEQQDEDYELGSTSFGGSAIGVQSWLAQLDEADTCADVQWSDDQAFASTHNIRVHINSGCPYSASYSSGSWNDEVSKWTPRTCDGRYTDDHRSQSSADPLFTDSDKTPCSSDYDFLEAAWHNDYVMIPRAELFRLWASQNTFDGDSDTMEIEPSIGDVWYITNRWLIVEIRRVADTPRRWLALIINWISRAHSRMRIMLGITTSSDQQQEDEDVQSEEWWDEP